MGDMGGDSWNAPNLPIGTIMQQIQSPTVTVVAGASANANFRTGLATGLATGQFALAIHSIRWNIFPTFLATTSDITGISMFAQISENLTQTAVTLTDPRSLSVEGVGFSSIVETGVGIVSREFQFLKTEDFVPAILTVAQSLNIVGTSSATIGFDAHCNIKYTLQQITDETQRNLIQRISLATQP